MLELKMQSLLSSLEEKSEEGNLKEILVVKEKILELIKGEQEGLKLLEKNDFSDLFEEGKKPLILNNLVEKNKDFINNNVLKIISENILNVLISKIYFKIYPNENLKEDKISIKKYKQLFNEELNNLKKNGNLGMYYYYKMVLLNLEGDKKYSIFLKKSSHKGYPKGTHQYLSEISGKFILNQNIDINYKKNNLEKIEEEFKKIINSKEENNYLYELLGDFYFDIGENKKSLDAYLEGIKSQYKGSYKLNFEISELYGRNKMKSKDNKKTEINYLQNFLKTSRINNDRVSVSKALVLLGEKDNKNYYADIIKNFNPEKGDLNSEQIILDFLKASRELNLKIKKKEYLLKILSKINSENLILLALHFEENGDIMNAFFNYIANYLENENKNSIDAILIFLEITLKDNINNEINIIKEENLVLKNDLIKKENNLFKKDIENLIKINNGNIKELKENLNGLKEAIKLIEKNEKILDEDIRFLFNISFDKNLLYSLNIEEILYFFEAYNIGINKSYIYLTEILKEIELMFGYEKDIFEKYYQKINDEKHKKFDKNYLDDFKDIIEASLKQLDNEGEK